MNSKVKSIIINVALFAVVVFLGIKVYQSIQAPIEFKNEKDRREKVIKQRLVDIRELEVMYKKVYNRYTTSFDTLKQFCKEYEIPVVKIRIDPTDTIDFNRTFNDTLRYVTILDSLFGGRNDFKIEEINQVPYSNPVTEFEIYDSINDSHGIPVQTIKVCTPFDVYLKQKGDKFPGSQNEWDVRVRNIKAEELRLQEIRNNTEDPDFAGLKIGSLIDVTLDGNWE